MPSPGGKSANHYPMKKRLLLFLTTILICSCAFCQGNIAKGINAEKLGLLDRAQGYYQQAVTDEPDNAEPLLLLGKLQEKRNHLDEAIVSLYQAVTINDTLAEANIYANMAVIQYQIHDFEGSETNFKKCRALYVALDNKFEIARTNANLANLYMEWGRFAESRKLYREAIAAFEDLERYDFLLLVYKNYGILFEKDLVKYDSANFYFEKAMACADQVEWPTGSLEEVVNVKADLLVEMGNLAVCRSEELSAKSYLEEAYALAEGNSYYFGMMQAALGLGQLYATQGKASLSMQYLDLYTEQTKKSGITMMESATKKPLILNYARLGRFDEMAKELDALDEQKQALQRETNDLYDQLSALQEETQGLFDRYDSQNEQIKSLQSQRSQYRLAFFGLLAIVLFIVVLFVAYKIVRKKRAKV